MKAKVVITSRELKCGEVVNVISINGDGRLATAEIEKQDGTKLTVMRDELEIEDGTN